MSEKNSGALHSLRLMLSRWKAPSAWDVVNRDEPLDPAPPGQWESNGTSGVTSTSTITIPAGTAMSVGNQVFVTTMARMATVAEEDAHVLRAIERARLG